MLSISNLKKLLDIAKDLKKQLALATLFGSLGHLTVVFFTLFLTLTFLKNGWVVYLFVVLAIALAFAKGMFSYKEQLLNHYVAFKILHVLRLKVMNKLKNISLNNFLKNNSGDYMTMITTDIEILEVFYAHTITPFLIYLSQMFVVSFVVALFNVKLALIVFALYFVMGILLPIFSKERGQKYGDDYRDVVTKITTNSSEESYAIFETIQYNKVDEMKNNFKKETKELTNSSYNKARFLINLNFANTVLYNVSILIFVSSASFFISDINTVIALSAMYMVSFTPVLYMGNISATLSQTMAAGSRFIALMDTPEETTKRGEQVAFDELRVDNVTFAYSDKNVLNNLSFSAKKGEIVGIVGESGSGKSTLAKLIMKFEDVTSGEIMIDGVKLDDIDGKFFRENSSIIMQDSYMFNSSIAKNVALFDKNIDREKLDTSFRSTNLTSFVDGLSRKENEIISERSSNISSGQKQRLSTSRSLYNDSKLLILDEATANIDIFSEIELLNSLEKFKEDKIILIISHNKSTLSICDKVVSVG